MDSELIQMVLLPSLVLIGNQNSFHFVHQFALLRFASLKLDGNKDSCPDLLPSVLLLKFILPLRIYLQKLVIRLMTVQRKNSRYIADWSYTQRIYFHSESYQDFTQPHMEVISPEYFLWRRSKVAKVKILQS